MLPAGGQGIRDHPERITFPRGGPKTELGQGQPGSKEWLCWAEPPQRQGEAGTWLGAAVPRSKLGPPPTSQFRWASFPRHWPWTAPPQDLLFSPRTTPAPQGLSDHESPVPGLSVARRPGASPPLLCGICSSGSPWANPRPFSGPYGWRWL